MGGTSATSAWVQTAATPASARAAAVSTSSRRPRATGERTTRMWSWPAKEMSAAKRPRPLSSGRSSSLGVLRPM